jgi:hypothetical protein
VADINKIIRGRTVRPTNADYNDPGGIHDDATAQGLGFRGGTIAASAHLDTFVPVLLDVFGEDWFRTGSLSMYFRHATTDGEPTHALVELPDAVPHDDNLLGGNWQNETLVPLRDAQIRAVIELSDGTLVGEGTASVGSPNEPTELDARDLRHDPSAARILADVSLGEVLGPFTAAVDGARVAQGCEHRITEALDWYRGASPFGGAIAPPSALIDLFANVAGDALLPRLGQAVGMWGAMEVRHHHGPLFVDHPYDVTITIASIGDSPKTEILWYDAEARDGEKLVASARILSRFVKASSPLYSL